MKGSKDRKHWTVDARFFLPLCCGQNDLIELVEMTRMLAAEDIISNDQSDNAVILNEMKRSEMKCVSVACR